jgi:hypothetical protein
MFRIAAPRHDHVIGYSIEWLVAYEILVPNLSV